MTSFLLDLEQSVPKVEAHLGGKRAEMPRQEVEGRGRAPGQEIERNRLVIRGRQFCGRLQGVRTFLSMGNSTELLLPMPQALLRSLVSAGSRLR